MDLLSNLQKKYYDLLRPVQSGLSNLGNAEKQGAQVLSQGIQQGATNVINQVGNTVQQTANNANYGFWHSPIVQGFNNLNNLPQPIKQGIYDLPASTNLLFHNIPGAINTMVMNPQQAGNLARTAPNYAQIKVPGMQTLANFSANAGQTFGQGLQNMAMGVNRVQNSPGILNKTAGVFQTIGGAGQTLAPFTAWNQVPNLISSLPQSNAPVLNQTQRLSAGIVRGMAGDNTLSPNIKNKNLIDTKILGQDVKIDPFEQAGQMLGFVKNPVNNEFFKLTDKILPVGNLLNKGTNIKKWVAVNGFNGSVQQLFTTMGQMPENATDAQKIAFMAQNAVIGAGMNIGGRALFDTGSKVGGKVINSKLAVNAYNELKDLTRKLNTPVTTMEFDANGNRIVKPLWQYQLEQKGGGLSVKDVNKMSVEDYNKTQPLAGDTNVAQQPITDIGTPGKTVDHLTKINNSNIDPTTIKLSGTPDELTAAKRAKSMVPIEKLDKPVILKINKDGNLQVVDGNARVTAHINQNQPITNWILNTKESDKVALNKFFPSSPQQPLGGVSDASTIRTNPTEGQISQKTPVTEGAGATEVKPLQLKSGESPQIPKNPENGVQSASDSIISKVKDKVNKFYTQSMDRFHPLSSLAHQAGEDRAMRNALTGYYGSGSTAQYHIDYELSPILKSVDVNELRKASIALRDAELQGRGIKGSNTGALGELLGKQGQGSKDPKMGEALQKLYKYQDNLVQEYLVKTGIMSPESYAAMKKNNQFYVPFKRVMDQVDEYLGGTPQTKGAGSVSGQNVIKGIKGSDKAIHDPLESIVENTYKLVGLGKRQEVAKTIVGLKDKLPEGVISKISGKLPLNKNNVVALFENGKVEHYKVPMEVADAAKGMSEEQMNMIVKVLAAPTRVFRATATGMNPEFAIPNVVRDVQSAFVNVGVNPLKWVSGLAHMIKQDEVYQEFLKSGGLTSRISLDRPYLKKTVADISGTPKQALRLTDPRRIKGVLEALGQYSEQPTRIASFEKTLSGSLKKGLSREEALKDAAYAAQEGTVNFARRGSKTQGLNAIYAFLNARAQGTDRIIRSIKADPKGAGIRLGMISVAPAIATYAWNRNFPSYNDKNVVPDYVKQNNFVIMLSNSPISQLGGAQYIAIPKGDVGKLANPIESFLSYADGKGGDVRGSLASTLGAFSPFNNIGDIIPTAIRPITENAANYNFFYGRPIVADSKKNYPAPYQTSKSTPAIYNQVGQFLNQSPNMIQNLSRGYLTGFARIGEQLTQPFANKDNYSGSDVNQTPIIRRFLQGPVRSQDEQQMQDFYQQKDIQNKIQDIKTGIKYGNIPMDAGMNEIKRLMNQQTQSTQPQSYFGAQSASASEKSPVQDKLQEDQAKMRVFMNQKSEMLGDKIYVPTDSGASVIDLNPQPTGTGIKAFVDQNKKYDIARQVWDAPISQEQKNAAFQKLGVDPQDVRYDSLAHNGTDVSVQYIKSKSPDHQTLLNNLVTGRVVSISGQQFAGDKVIDALNSQGLLSDAESKALKALKLDRNMNNIAKVKSGRGRKPRLIKVKAIKIPKTKRIKIKTPKITKVKQYTLSKVTKVKKLKA